MGTANCRTWRHAWASITSPCRTCIPRAGWTHRIRASLSITTVAFCVTAACEYGEIEGAHTWDVMGRGMDARIIADLNEPWGSSESCTSCGKCVHLCPTGALFEKGKSVAEMSKRKQFLPYLTLMRETRQ